MMDYTKARPFHARTSPVAWKSTTKTSMERGTTMRNEFVYSHRDAKRVLAKRQSNRTILVDKSKLADSDETIVTDKIGHRYARSVHLEHSGEYFVFEMI